MNRQKHPIEASESWKRYVQVSEGTNTADREEQTAIFIQQQRRLTHRNVPIGIRDDNELLELEEAREKQYWKNYKQKLDHEQKVRNKKVRKHTMSIQELYRNPGINAKTVHGLMIDAGSSGSRMHIYEWEPRILRSNEDIQAAVSGQKISFPDTDSRWTDRLRPGLASFATIQDDDIMKNSISDYLQPLLDFAENVLHAKDQDFAQYPIFLQATAGMRTLQPADRSRIMRVVRSLFSDPSYNPFYFVDEHARVLSGEEEAIYDWTGVNFLMGKLLHDSEGLGDVINIKSTYGALDLGGASTQISFYDPNEDIMANLSKLHLGQGKHWNVYAHSFLYYGINEAINRFGARLAAEKTPDQRLIEGIYNPCLPGGSSMRIRTDIHLLDNGVETWEYNKVYPSGDGFYQATLFNKNKRGDFDTCLELTKDLLHTDVNAWCNFSQRNDCSLAGTYQPKLPADVEFVGFSNYFDVWQFLMLPERATLYDLERAARRTCSMTKSELEKYNNGQIDNDELLTYCFRSTYVFQLLHNGYGFKLDDTIRVVDVIGGQKVGWTLGAMLYEINTMPWSYEQSRSTIWDVQSADDAARHSWDGQEVEDESKSSADVPPVYDELKPNNWDEQAINDASRPTSWNVQAVDDGTESSDMPNLIFLGLFVYLIINYFHGMYTKRGLRNYVQVKDVDDFEGLVNSV